MILCPWIFQHTSPKNKSHIPITMPWKGSIVHCLGTACVITFFSVVSDECFLCFPLPFRIHIHSKHSRWRLCPSFLVSEIFFPSSSPFHGILWEMWPTVLQHSAHSGFVWFTCWWAFELFLVWGYWMLWVFLYELLSLCILFISLGEMPWGGTTGSYVWYVYF